jgi:hypothetical protein
MASWRWPGGGLLFHYGVYPVSFAQMLLGAPEAVVAHGVVLESGADVEESVMLRYPGGRSALLFASCAARRPAQDDLDVGVPGGGRQPQVGASQDRRSPRSVWGRDRLGDLLTTCQSRSHASDWSLTSTPLG